MSQKSDMLAEGIIEGSYTALLDYPVFLDEIAIGDKGEQYTFEKYPNAKEDEQTVYFAGFMAGYEIIINRKNEEGENYIRDLANLITSLPKTGALRIIKEHFHYIPTSLPEKLEEIIQKFHKDKKQE